MDDKTAPNAKPRAGEHRPEPWQVDNLRVEDSAKSIVALTQSEANAKRIVACVNACEGISDPEKWIEVARNLADDSLKVVANNDALVEALQKIADLAIAPMVDMADPAEDQARDWSNVAATAWNTARSALAKHGR